MTIAAIRSTIPPLGLELVGDDFWIVMLPDVDHAPASFSEELVVASIAGSGRGQLLCPPLGVRLRQGSVRRTSMPETTIDEQRDTKSNEHDIGFSREITDMKPKSEAPPMKGATQRHLGTGVPRSLPSHERANRLGRCSRPLAGLSHVGAA
jgi:hypothetical protein